LVADVLGAAPIPEQQEQTEKFQRHHGRRLLLVVATDRNRPAVGARSGDGVASLTQRGAAVGLLSALEFQPERPAAGRENVGFLGGAASRLREPALRLNADALAQPSGHLALKAMSLGPARSSAHARTLARLCAVVTPSSFA
jgi:hypothetical protein